MARGTNARGDIPVDTLGDGTDTARLFQDLIDVMKTHNDKRNSLRTMLGYPVTVASEHVLQTYAGAEFEEASEFGEPVGYRAQMDSLQLGFQFKWWDLANRSTWQFLADASRQQVDAIANQAMEADNKLVFKHVMGALLDNVSRMNDEGNTVYPLYNADGTVPPDYEGDSFNGTHNHYITSDTGTLDSTDIDALTVLVNEHGYGLGDSTTGRLVLFANKAQADVMRGFRVASGDSFDFIASDLAPPYLTQDTLVGDKPPSTFGNMPVAGSYGSALIVESSMVPAGYVMAVVSNGPNSPYNPVGFRQHTNGNLQGLRIVGGGTDYPLTNSFYVRGMGTGVRLRGAGAVLQVTSNATYTVPSKFDL